MSTTGIITVLMSSSPILSHPSVEVIDKVLKSTQFQIPDVDTVILCDGVRVPEHESRREGYEEYKRRLLSGDHGWTRQLQLREWGDSVQQAFMFREALRSVKTPLVLMQEHDYAFTYDPIDWEGIINVLQQERANVIRFHNLEEIHPLHQHLMLDCFEGADGHHGGRKICEPPLVCGVPLIRTVQYWGCPHIAPTKWFREQLEDLRKFSANTYTEIEPALYGHICDAPWENYKLMVYAPSEPSMRRSVHISGRGHTDVDPKRDFVF